MKVKGNILFSLICVIGLFLAGCSFLEDRERVNGLLSDEEDKYSLFITGPLDSITYEILEENNIRNVNTIRVENSLQYVQGRYGALNIVRTPAYVVLNDKVVVYKTYDMEDLFDFLQNNEPTE